MLIIRVVQEHNGWSIRNGEGVKTPFRSKTMAVSRANMLAGALRRHGATARVIVENEASAASVGLAYAAGSSKVSPARPDGARMSWPPSPVYR